MKQRLVVKITTLLHSVPLVRNLARKKFVARFVLGLFKSRNVQFCEVAQHLNDGVKLASNETRIQDFFREADLDYVALAVLLVGLLPGTGKLRLCIDRTEWDFGRCQVNILLVTVGRGDCHWPLCWELLDNRSGNSGTTDRRALLDFCLRVLGPGRVGLVVGDREFVGHAWFKYRKDKDLLFVMRLPKHPLLTDPQGHRHAVADWGLRPGQCPQLPVCQVDGVWGGAQVTALAGGEYLFLFGTANPAFLGQFYRKRWTIEACFQNLKGRGFALRATHLRCRDKLKKLVGLVSLAYALCVSVGTRLHEKVQPIPQKNNGYKRASFGRHGLNALRQYTRPGRSTDPVFTANMNAVFRWIINQLTHYKATKIVG